MKQSVLFKSTARHRQETNEVLKKGGLDIPQQLKDRLTSEFRRSLEIKKLLGTHGNNFLITSAIIAFFLFIILISTIKPGYLFYILYIPFCALFLYLSYYFGNKFLKWKRKISTLQIIEFYFDSLVDWSMNKLKSNVNKNEKRIIIENLVNCFYDYIQHKRQSIWNFKLKNKRLSILMNMEQSVELFKLSISLFEKVFSTERGRFMAKGILIISKIF